MKIAGDLLTLEMTTVFPVTIGKPASCEGNRQAELGQKCHGTGKHKALFGSISYACVSY